MKRNRSGTRKFTHFSFFLFVFSITFAFLLSEIILRIFGIGYGNAPLEASKIYHHVNPSDYQYIVHDPRGEYGGHTVIFDEFRYRVPKKTERLTTHEYRRIYFFGDSFTVAIQESWSNSFVGKVGLNNQVYVRNMGVSSYSPIHYLVQVKKELSKLSNADVVVQLFENDFDNDNLFRGIANSTDPNKIESIDGGPSSKMIKILRYSYLARLIRKVQLQIYFLIDSSSSSSSSSSLTSDYKTEQEINNQHSFDKRIFSYEILKEIKKITDMQGARLHLMIIPSRTLSQNNNCCLKDWLHEEVKDFANVNKISFIDLAKDFQEASNQKALFFKSDIHLTAVGNDLVARSIKNHLSLQK